MGVKISELEQIYSPNSSDMLIINNDDHTRIIEAGDLIPPMISAYLNEHINDYLSDYISSSTIGDYLSDYITSSNINDYLSDYITSSNINDYLSDYINSSNIYDYLSDYVSSSTISDYISNADIASYLSEGLGTLSEFMTSSAFGDGEYVDSFASALSAYLSSYGGQTIYDAISQYINQ